jgi:hypothetical protein
MGNRPLPTDVARDLAAMARDDTERQRLHDALARLRDDLVGPADEVTERRHLVAMRTAGSGDAPSRPRRRRSHVASDDPSLALARLTGRIGFTPTDEALPDRLLQAIARMSRAARGADTARSRHGTGSHATHPSGGGNGESRRDAGPPGQGGPPPASAGGGPGGSRLRWSHRYPAD